MAQTISMKQSFACRFLMAFMFIKWESFEYMGNMEKWHMSFVLFSVRAGQLVFSDRMKSRRLRHMVSVLVAVSPNSVFQKFLNSHRLSGSCWQMCLANSKGCDLESHGYYQVFNYQRQTHFFISHVQPGYLSRTEPRALPHRKKWATLLWPKAQEL